MNTLGETIKRYREQKGMDAVALARECNISQGYVSMIESGDRNPSGKVLRKIAEVLDISIHDLTNLTNKLTNDDELYIDGDNTAVYSESKSILDEYQRNVDLDKDIAFYIVPDKRDKVFADIMIKSEKFTTYIEVKTKINHEAKDSLNARNVNNMLGASVEMALAELINENKESFFEKVDSYNYKQREILREQVELLKFLELSINKS